MSDQIPSDEVLNIAGMSTVVRRELARVLNVDPDVPVADIIHAARSVVIERREAREWYERYRPLLEQARAPSPTDPITVYAHVERTVHRLLDDIDREASTRISSPEWSHPVKQLAEAVQALSAWPQFNPMNAHEQYQKLAKYEVERAIKQQGVRISGGTIDSERTDVGAAFDVVFSKLTALSDRIAKLEGDPR